MLRLSDSVFVLDCPALVAGSYSSHVPVRAAPVELPYQATTEAVQADSVAGQPDSDTDSQAAATPQAPLRCKRKRRKGPAKDQAHNNASEAAANRRHAAIQPTLQSALAVFQDWLSKQDVQRLPDALRRGGALPPVPAATGATMPGPACSMPASSTVLIPQAAGSGDVPARESPLDLLALAELKAVLKPKFVFLGPGGDPELPGCAPPDAGAASAAARCHVRPSSSLLAAHVPPAASTACGVGHCSSCLGTVLPACKALSPGACTEDAAQHRCSCLRSCLPPPHAPRMPAQAHALAPAGPGERVDAGGSAQGCNLFDVLIGNACGEERTALAFQTAVLVPPRARFLLSNVTRLRPLLPSAPGAFCAARCVLHKRVVRHTP